MDELMSDIFSRDINLGLVMFKNILDSISDYIFIMKFDKNRDSFTYLFANQSALTALNFTEEVYGKSLEDVLDSNRSAMLKTYYNEAMRTKDRVTFESLTPADNGELIRETVINPIAQKNGEYSIFFSIGRDIEVRPNKERQLVDFQAELQKNQLRTNSLIEHNLDAVFEIDLDGHFRMVNKATEQIVGYQRNELIGNSFVHLLAREEVNRVVDFFHKTVNGATQEYETIILGRFGNRIYLDIKNIPIIINGTVDGVYGIAKNITKTKKIESEKEEIKEQLELVWNHSSDAIFLLSKEGIINANPSFTKLLGFTLEEIKEAMPPPIYPKQKNNNFEQYYQKMTRGEKIINQEVQRVTKDGKLVDILASYCPVDNGRILTVAMYRDITERKKMEKSLKASEERYRTLIESSPEPFLLLDGTEILYCNPKALELFGAESFEKVKGKNALDFIHPSDREITLERNKQLYQGKDLPLLDRKVITPDGRNLILEMSGKFINFEDKQALLISARDVTERKRAEDRANYLALHDDLTGLGNRRLFKKKLKEIMNQVKKDELIAVMTMDIDDFKHINDTFGHDVGDEVLRKASIRLKEIVAERFIICRLGGDEVGIICPTTTREEVECFATIIQREFSNCMDISRHSIKVEFSIGIALYPDHGLDENSLKKCSDIALYHVKKTGKKGWALYSDVIGREHNRRLTLKHKLEEAILNNEFTLHYQPRINSSTGEINCVEALIRWAHSTPDVFIPIAEENGLIIPIGEWVTRTACQQLKDWQNHGIPLQKISINLSIHQLLYGENFYHRLTNILRETGMKPECLEFEITERFISNDEKVISYLERCKELGISFSIDDFGKEYSSLWQLTQLPFDSIKLDRSFIAKINEDKKLNVVIEAILHMAKSLNLKVVGEGVETKEQTIFLKGHGVDELQGFYFSKPISSSEIEKLFEQGKNWLLQLK